MERTKLRSWGRIVTWTLTLILISMWIFKPGRGPWDALLALLAFMAAVGNEGISRLKPAATERFASNAARVRHREAMRKVLQEEIHRLRAGRLRQDVIVRDVDRADRYPDHDPTPGISSWFRIGLLDTYSRGVIVGLRYGGLKKCESGYRFVDWVNEEASDETVMLLGDIPFDSIAEVNLDGDGHYPYAHIYCHFDASGQPYERLWFGKRVDTTDIHYYFEHIADYEDVERNNPPDGTLSFG